MGIFNRDNKRHPREWLPVAAQIIRDANERIVENASYGQYRQVEEEAGAHWNEAAHNRAHRSFSAVKRRAQNLSVRVGPGATGQVPAPAYYNEATREVVLNSDVALPGVDPATVRWSQDSWRRKHRRAVGLMEHEIGHAAHTDTKWLQNWQRAGADVREFGAILEETRMESQVLNEGGDREALAAVAHELILRDAHVAEDGDAWQDAMGAALIIGREYTNGGCLTESAVRPFREAYAAKHGQAWVDTLDRLIGEYNPTADHRVPDGNGMRALMEAWQAALSYSPEPGDGDGDDEPGESDGDGEPGEGESQSQPSDDDDGDGDELSPDDDNAQKSIRELLAEAVDLSEQEIRDAVANADNTEQQEDAQEVKRIVHGQAQEGTDPIVLFDRETTPLDHKLKSEMTRHLQALSLPEVAKDKVRQQLPPGRMIGRGAVTRDAQRASGQVVSADLFRHNRKRITTTPPPVIGLMTDCSGSMREAQPGVATLAWALSEAGRAINARTALVAFGETSRLIEHDSRKVFTANATHGWENFTAGFKRLNDRLHLTDPYRGARVLIIVSDGGYGRPQGMAAAPIVRHLERRGVAVVWAAIGCEWKGAGRGIDAGAVLEMPVAGTPTEVAHALTETIEAAMRAARVTL